MTERGSRQRAWLYIVIAAVAFLSDKPTLADWHVWVGLVGAVAVAYRAYIDTSVSDAKGEK